MNPPLRIEPLRTSTRAALRRLYDAYLEEIARFGARYRRRPDGRWEYRGEDGRWAPDHLAYWLAPGPEHQVLLLRSGRAIAGFAMVGVRPAVWLPRGVDASIAEFYVAPRFRGRGLGQRAAHRIVRRHPGLWEVSQVPGNGPAIAFWRAVIGRFTGKRVRELVIRGGPAQRFRSPGEVPERDRPSTRSVRGRDGGDVKRTGERERGHGPRGEPGRRRRPG